MTTFGRDRGMQSGSESTDWEGICLPPPPAFQDPPAPMPSPQLPPSTPSRPQRGAQNPSFAYPEAGNRCDAKPDAATAVGSCSGQATVDKKFMDDFFCDLSRSDAMEALEAVQMDGAFIVRPGNNSPYCISFLHCGETKHVRIQSNSSGQYFLGDTKVEMYFDSMSLLMDYITKNVIQDVNGVVFRLIINAKPYSQKMLTGSRQVSAATPFPACPYPTAEPSHSPQQLTPAMPPPLPTHSLARRNSSFATVSAGAVNVGGIGGGRGGGIGGGIGGGGGGGVGGGIGISGGGGVGGGIGISGIGIGGGGCGGGIVGNGASVQPTVAVVHPEVPRIRPLKQEHYFADVRRDEAEAHLMNTRREGHFLVRPSKASAYCLSAFHRGRVVHLKIVCVSNRFVLEQLMNDGQTFSTVPDLIDALTLSKRTLTLINGDSIVLRVD